MAGKRIGLLSAWASRANGGIFEAIVSQVALLRSLGAVPVVLAVEDEAHEQDRHRLGDCETHVVVRFGPRGLAYSPDLDRILFAADLDLLHLHGIWQLPSHAAGKWARRTGRPMLLSPHGMLDPWITRRNLWKKVPARIAWEERAWRAARAFHALTDDEARDIAREVPDAVTEVIPNCAPPPTRPRVRMPDAGAFYLGRIHEKKNIGALIEGWRLARAHLPQGARLTIAGWGDAASVDALNRTLLPEDPSVDFVGTVFASQKAALLDVARFLVLPTRSEGLPVTVLEAWSAGVPSIMTSACHLPEGYVAGAAIECGTEPTEIAASLIDAFSRSEAEWLTMSHAAQSLADTVFGEAVIREKWLRSYASLLKD